MAKGKAPRWTADPRDVLRVRDGFDLAAFDLRATPGWTGNKAAAEALMASRGQLLSELQERLFAEGRAGGKRSVLVVVQGLDTAGKGGIARHVMGLVDPQGVQVRSFGVPTEEERQHDYLWRIRRALPTPGHIGLFDRSQYEDVLVVRVDNLVPQDVWEKRYDEINQFERELVDSGTIVLKFALMVSHEEQGLRLMERIDRPDKRWKYSASDLKTRSKWDAFQAAYQTVFERTNTDFAPWYALPADRKWYPRLAVTEILTRTLIGMDLGWPEAGFDPAEQRRALADTMSTTALEESLAETRESFQKSVESSEQVQEESAEVLGGSKHLHQHLADRRDVIRAEMEQALTQKQELLAARGDAS